MTILERCAALAQYSEEPDRLTRTFLSPPTRDVHRTLSEWMKELGMMVRVDAAGNLRGVSGTEERRLLIGSHIDTVPGAGAYDGVLGVVLGIALVEAVKGRELPFGIEVVAFSEEEGVRFGVPFIGSRALAGTLDAALLAVKDRDGITVGQAIRDFGLDPTLVPEAAIDPATVIGYLEFHIEQGPALESLGLPLGVVTAIAGQSRFEMIFQGRANHAGTTPMPLRRDALTAAAEWILLVEETARDMPGLVATVGRIEALPGAGNVIAGQVHTSLDIRHADDAQRLAAVDTILGGARRIAQQRGLTVQHALKLDQLAVPCDPGLISLLEQSLEEPHRMVSGAGHDAMVLASLVPAAMLFVRSPGGVSHSPDESVLAGDVDSALQAGLRFLGLLEASHG